MNIEPFTPDSSYVKMKRFHAWVQTIVPFVYDNSLSFYEVIGKMAEYLNEMRDRQNQLSGLYDSLVAWCNDAIAEQTDFIQKFTDNLRAEWNQFSEDMKNQFKELSDEINQELNDFETKIQQQQNAFETKINGQIETWQNEWSAYKNNLNTEWSTYQTNLTNNWNTYQQNLNKAWEDYQSNLNNEWNNTQNYIQNYFSNLDISSEIQQIFNEMLTNGELQEILSKSLGVYIELKSITTQPETPEVGDIYYNSEEYTFYLFTNNTWKPVDYTKNNLFGFNSILYRLNENAQLEIVPQTSGVIYLPTSKRAIHNNYYYRVNFTTINGYNLTIPSIDIMHDGELFDTITFDTPIETNNNMSLASYLDKRMDFYLMKRSMSGELIDDFTFVILADKLYSYNTFTKVLTKKEISTEIPITSSSVMRVQGLKALISYYDSGNKLMAISLEPDRNAIKTATVPVDSTLYMDSVVFAYNKSTNTIYYILMRDSSGNVSSLEFIELTQTNPLTFTNKYAFYKQATLWAQMSLCFYSANENKYYVIYNGSLWEVPEPYENYSDYNVLGYNQNTKNYYLCRYPTAGCGEFSEDFIFIRDLSDELCGENGANLKSCFYSFSDVTKGSYFQSSNIASSNTNFGSYYTYASSLIPFNYLTKEEADSYYQPIGYYVTEENANNTYLSKDEASTTYLTQANANSTYLSKDDASDTYLTQANANTTYLPKNEASSTYLTQANANTTYQKKSDMGKYVTSNVNGTQIVCQNSQPAIPSSGQIIWIDTSDL